MANKIIDIMKEYSDNAKGFVEVMKSDNNSKPETLFILSMAGHSNEQLCEWFDLSKSRTNVLITNYKKQFFKSYFENTLYLQLMLEGGINNWKQTVTEIISIDKEKLKSKEIVLKGVDELQSIESNIEKRQKKFMCEFNKELIIFMKNNLGVSDKEEVERVFKTKCKPLFNDVILEE